MLKDAEAGAGSFISNKTDAATFDRSISKRTPKSDHLIKTTENPDQLSYP